MDKEKKQLIIVGILVIVFIIMLLNSFKKKPTPADTNKPVPVAAVAAKPPVTPAVTLPLKPDEKRTNAQLERAKLPWGKSPFAATAEKDYLVGELQLKGISFDEKRGSFAYINNEIIKKGDSIADYEVVEIERDKVLLKKGNQSFYLVFPGQE